MYISQGSVPATVDEAKNLTIDHFAPDRHVRQCFIPPLVAVIQHLADLVKPVLGRATLLLYDGDEVVVDTLCLQECHQHVNA